MNRGIRRASPVRHARQPGLQDAAPAFVTIHDIDHLSATWGRWDWGDERFYHHAKLPCSPEHLVDYAHSLASLILAQLGVVKKCLVLDLDNTLWGGVIGDDGLGGIRLGQGDPESESFVAFQRYVKGLRERGVILAVCSKNTDSIAREVFEKHPEMVLASRRHLLLRRQLGRQGNQPRQDRRAAQYRLELAGLRG